MMMIPILSNSCGMFNIVTSLFLFLFTILDRTKSSLISVVESGLENVEYLYDDDILRLNIIPGADMSSPWIVNRIPYFLFSLLDLPDNHISLYTYNKICPIPKTYSNSIICLRVMNQMIAFELTLEDAPRAPVNLDTRHAFRGRANLVIVIHHIVVILD